MIYWSPNTIQSGVRRLWFSSPSHNATINDSIEQKTHSIITIFIWNRTTLSTIQFSGYNSFIAVPKTLRYLTSQYVMTMLPVLNRIIRAEYTTKIFVPTQTVQVYDQRETTFRSRYSSAISFDHCPVWYCQFSIISFLIVKHHSAHSACNRHDRICFPRIPSLLVHLPYGKGTSSQWGSVKGKWRTVR